MPAQAQLVQVMCCHNKHTVSSARACMQPRAMCTSRAHKKSHVPARATALANARRIPHNTVLCLRAHDTHLCCCTLCSGSPTYAGLQLRRMRFARARLLMALSIPKPMAPLLLPMVLLPAPSAKGCPPAPVLGPASNRVYPSPAVTGLCQCARRARARLPRATMRPTTTQGTTIAGTRTASRDATLRVSSPAGKKGGKHSRWSARAAQRTSMCLS